MKSSLSAVLVALLVSIAPLPVFADISVLINFAPPELPVYEQPILLDEGYIWIPGYWAYGEDGYYWVPGTWVLPPFVGFLWTPPYWSWSEGYFIFHPGYWGPHVGYYGGINYGYGYYGYGYEGGRWDDGRFYYNQSVNNINITNVHNTYNETVINNVTINRVSYNGGNGGTNATPSAEERAAERESHIAATAEQTKHEQTARAKPELRQSVNHGRPPIAATPKLVAFEGPGVVPARAADLNPAADKRGEGKARTNAEQLQAPAAAPESGPSENVKGAEPRANAPATANSKWEQRQQLTQQPKTDAQPEQQQARPQQEQRIQRREKPRQQPPTEQPSAAPQAEQQARPQQEQQRQQQ